MQRCRRTLEQIYLPSAGGGPGAAVGDRARSRSRPRRCRSTTSAQFPATTISFNLRAGARWARRSTAIRRRRARARHAAEHQHQLPGRGARPSESSLANELLLILAAVVAIYIVLGVLYESFIHPVTILSTLPSAGVGALLALMLAGNDLGDHRRHRHHPADRHREEERDHDDRLRARRGARAGPGAARGHPPGLPAALPADPDDDDGGDAGRAAADARLRAPARSCAIRWASPSSAD